MFTFVAVLHVVICIFLVVIILMQSAKGHGLAGAFGSFGGGVAQNLFGGQAGDVLAKVTTFIAVGFVVTSLTLAVLSAKRSLSIMAGEKMEAVAEKKIDAKSEKKAEDIPPLESNVKESAPVATSKPDLEKVSTEPAALPVGDKEAVPVSEEGQ